MTEQADAAKVARVAATLYDEVHAAVSAEPVGSLARRLHSALGDLAHAVLTAPDPAAAEARGEERALREAADNIVVQWEGSCGSCSVNAEGAAEAWLRAAAAAAAGGAR